MRLHYESVRAKPKATAGTWELQQVSNSPTVDQSWLMISLFISLVFLQVWSSADGALWAFCDESAPCGGESCGAGCSELPGLVWGRKQHGWEMLPCPLPQQRPSRSAVWRGAHSPRHQCGALDGTDSHTHKTHTVIHTMYTINSWKAMIN